MNFAELYKNNRHAVTRALTAMWCGETNNASQQAYAKQLKEEVIPELFAPKDAIPVAQCMNLYKSVFSVPAEQAKSIVGELWKNEFDPYEHQYQCWNTLLNERTSDDKPKSICVTTGTGSGKTECFMMPLIYDLLQNPKQNEIQALFLYPLNALMEDQKERMEELLLGTDITYTVYNGDLPEDEPNPTDTSDEANRLRRRIAQIRGEYVEDGETKYRFAHMVYTRKMVRSNPPNIILTNPTMLEYILLRDKDRVLTVREKKSLRWIAIDETHSYNGAGAAEIAMLLRRVLIAFNVQASDIRFATSSATFGNGADPVKEREQLQEFIAGITGLKKDQVVPIGGERIGEDEIPNNEDENRWKLIFHKDYVSLDELFPSNNSVEEKLQLLDKMCERAESSKMKVKVHYFHRVPNNGLFIRLNEHNHGAFKIYNKNVISDDDAVESPLLELSRCKQCGEYLAVARITLSGAEYGKYEPVEADDSDIFDLIDNEEDNSEKRYAIIGLSDISNQFGDNNVSLVFQDGRLDTMDAGVQGEWHLVANTHRCCPYCNSKLTKSGDHDADSDNPDDLDSAYLQKFRLSADFISRMMAPAVLDQLEKNPTADSNKPVLHNGQQYISFADSRQMAARATMKQNLEQERMWVYSTIFHALCKKKAGVVENQAKLKALTEKYSSEELLDHLDELKNLKANVQEYLTWDEISKILLEDKHCKVFAQYFVKRSGDSDELDEIGNIPESILFKYVQSIMVMYLSNRPATAASPETLGLFHACYPQLLKITELPDAVKEFNNSLGDVKYHISIEDWRNYLQIFMDYTVRSNQSVFLKIPGNNQIDIFGCNRFATEKPRRRPAKMPVLDAKKPSNSRMVLYLSTILANDKGIASTNEAYKNHYDLIYGVIHAMWDCLTANGSELLEPSQKLGDNGNFVTDRDDDNTGTNRLNLYNLSFKLYDEVYLCDANTRGGDRHVENLRPVANNFKKFSPYLSDSAPVLLEEKYFEKWELFPNYIGSGTDINSGQLKEWAQAKRQLLWNNSLWGEEGVFSDRLFDIYSGPKLFIQAEHTAQVDKYVARQIQQDFRAHTINVLACSTTMEMGVDLGNLEVVMMTSVPPQPSNYKQRAGRSGRNNRMRSVAITLCSSDAIGLRTLLSPIESIINRSVNVPKVDLKSPQVIQRHVNSFLIRAFGVFSVGKDGGGINQRVINFYTPFQFTNDGGRLKIVDANGNGVEPPHLLGDVANTPYEKFNEQCGLPLEDEIRKELKLLLHDTFYEDQIQIVVRQSAKDNDRCYSELRKKVQGFKFAYEQAGTSNPPNLKFQGKLRLQYMEVLNTRLLEYWATSRFTPNANMPVNVISLNLNSSGKIDFFTPQTSSNPSYSLREAIAQYAPGNSVVVDGVTYVVRGVEYTNINNNINTFKTIYRNDLKTVIDDPNSIANRIPWRVNNKEGLELIQPIGFLPDINEDGGRVIENNKFTRVSAQLIDTDEWNNAVTEPLLFSVRKNLNTGNAKILYYNEGLGYGYCFCTRCGRMVLEDTVAESPFDQLPAEFNQIRPSDPQRPRYHLAISGKESRRACSGSSSRDSIRRNVIIGDLIQTDYSEIRIRHKGENQWISRRTNNENLLFTLGIVFCQSLVETFGKERGAVDFTIMPNAHICIFDTNPGGAGYANQLADYSIMKQIIDNAKQILLKSKAQNSKDILLDKFTLRFQKYIDVEGALEWIENEQAVREIIPTEIEEVFPSNRFYTVPVTLNVLKLAFENSAGNLTLFALNDYKNWDYNGGENGWFGQLFSHFSKHPTKTTFCIIEHTNFNIPEPVLDMIRSINGWTSKVTKMPTPYEGRSIYPLAYIDGKLYFTNCEETATLDFQWGSGAIFAAQLDDFSNIASIVDTTLKPNTCIFKLSGAEHKTIKTKELGSIIQKNSNGIIDNFIEHCLQSKSELVIKYQDEHLKSVLGIITTLQVIGHIVEQANCNFKLEFLVEKYYENKDDETNITKNLPSDRERDYTLEVLTTEWLDFLESENNIVGKLEYVESKERRTLTHWRVLSITCGSKTMHIYPDGGFINGWIIGRTGNNKYFELNNTNTEDNITLQRVEDIKFDVCLENTQD